MIDKPTYELWAKEFEPSSSFDGSWQEGSTIYFTGRDKDGKRMGMVSEIVENIPGEVVAIRHKGILDGDSEITEGPRAEKWANSREIYRFEEQNGVTNVSVELDMTEEYVEMMNSAWDRALNKLKELCEQ